MTLNTWLIKIQAQHPTRIALDLTRVRTVAQRLNVLKPNCPVITVAGTNGKGSCVIALENIYTASGYATGVFISPYFFSPAEQIRVKGRSIDEATLCKLFAEIEKARADISLTEFEFYTLAALLHFTSQKLDLWILEVGMGGARDAVNIVDPNLAIITNVALDHQQWLGHTREAIAAEKAGILREGVPLIYGEEDVPESIKARAGELIVVSGDMGAFLRGWGMLEWQSRGPVAPFPPSCSLRSARGGGPTRRHPSSLLLWYSTLPKGEGCVVRASSDAREGTSEGAGRRHASEQDAAFSLPKATELQSCSTLPGRFQIVQGSPLQIFDVAHNPHAAQFLAKRLEKISIKGKIHAVFSMLKDKDIAGSVAALAPFIDTWHIAPLSNERAASLVQIETAFQAVEIKQWVSYQDIDTAHRSALTMLDKEDVCLIWGSFYTLAACSKFSELICENDLLQ